MTFARDDDEAVSVGKTHGGAVTRARREDPFVFGFCLSFDAEARRQRMKKKKEKSPHLAFGGIRLGARGVYFVSRDDVRASQAVMSARASSNEPRRVSARARRMSSFG